MPIIFVTGHGDIPMTVQAMKAGAVEFLTKPFKGDVLLQSVRNAVERSRTLLGREEENQTLKTRYADLTSRERDVLALVVSGLLNKQVGSRLGISEVTVKKHRGNSRAEGQVILGSTVRFRPMRSLSTHSIGVGGVHTGKRRLRRYSFVARGTSTSQSPCRHTGTNPERRQSGLAITR